VGCASVDDMCDGRRRVANPYPSVGTQAVKILQVVPTERYGNGFNGDAYLASALLVVHSEIPAARRVVVAAAVVMRTSGVQP
jgi:hypothetical protein